MFYLKMHSTHFYLLLYGVGHMVTDQSDTDKAVTWVTLSD